MRLGENLSWREIYISGLKDTEGTEIRPDTRNSHLPFLMEFAMGGVFDASPVHASFAQASSAGSPTGACANAGLLTLSFRSYVIRGLRCVISNQCGTSLLLENLQILRQL